MGELIIAPVPKVYPIPSYRTKGFTLRSRLVDDGAAKLVQS